MWLSTRFARSTTYRIRRLAGGRRKLRERTSLKRRFRKQRLELQRRSRSRTRISVASPLRSPVYGNRRVSLHPKATMIRQWRIPSSIARLPCSVRRSHPTRVSLSPRAQELITCEVASSSIERLSIALPRIVKAVSLQGFELVAGKEAANFKSETEIVDFSIVEAVRREKHAQTDAERAQDEAWQRKRDRAARRNSWENVFFDRPRFPEWDYHPTGQLSFELEHIYVFGGAAPRRSFRDAKVQRLENIASDIAVGLAVLAAAKTEQRLRREADQRRMEQERLRRELAARAKHIEDRRTAGLGAILTELDELDRLRRLVAMINKEVPSAPAPRLAAFLIWAKEHLAKREALLSAQGIEDRFEALQLFGDDDDHAFRSTSWT